MGAWWPMLLQEAPAEPHMTSAGWLFLGLAWLFVTVLAVWCFRRVLGGGRQGP